MAADTKRCQIETRHAACLLNMWAIRRTLLQVLDSGHRPPIRSFRFVGTKHVAMAVILPTRIWGPTTALRPPTFYGWLEIKMVRQPSNLQDTLAVESCPPLASTANVAFVICEMWHSESTPIRTTQIFRTMTETARKSFRSKCHPALHSHWPNICCVTTSKPTPEDRLECIT